MYAVKLMRRRLDRDEEEYGRVLLEGETVSFQGLSTVFQAYLRRGIQDEQHGTHTPKDGISFLKQIEHYCFDVVLYATHIQEIPASLSQ